MKHSLRLKVTLLLTALLTLTIFLFWLLNQTFLESYYQNDKVRSLSDSYRSLNQLVGNRVLSQTEDEYEQEENNKLIKRIEKLEAADTINYYILSEYYDPFFMTYTMYFRYPTSEMLKDTKTMQYERVKNAVKAYLFNDITGTGLASLELMRTDERFSIYKVYDNNTESFYIDLFGHIDNGNLVLIRSNFESIHESAAISSRFLGITGVVVTIFGSLLMFIFSRSFTRPIKELSVIAKSMASLDFEVKYTRNNNDETGELGNSINDLSEKLEKTITELKGANIELEKDIARKTQLEEMRTEFLSNVSHELKTPIALIQGYAEGLQANINDDAESREFYCDVIIDEAQKMNSMVKKLLSLNQIEFGYNRLEPERFDIVSLVNSVVNSSDILIRQKGAEINNNCEVQIFVWADQYLVEEVVTNYLSNALNHLDGNRIIDIKFSTTEKNVRVSIFNTGNKIPSEELENIWIKFYKVDKARTREYGGNGIGLSIVKAIMEAHNQSCGVINHEAGVEFWFELDTVSEE